MTGESGMIEGDDMSEESGEVEVVEATLAGPKTTGLEEVAIQQEISQDEAEGADKTPARGLLLEEKKHCPASMVRIAKKKSTAANEMKRSDEE